MSTVVGVVAEGPIECEKNTGVRDPRREPDKFFRYVDITSVDNKSKRIVEAKTLLGKDAPSRARQIIRSGDVIVSTTRPNLNAVALVPSELGNQICSTGFCVLRAAADLDSDYLFALVQATDFVESLSVSSKAHCIQRSQISMFVSKSFPCRRWRSRSRLRGF